MLIESGSTLVMIGDSITDVGRDRPVGCDEGIGWGYPRFVASFLAASYPERKIRTLNTGIGGNTIRDLDERWAKDVIALKPDWLSVMIGTNDVWRYFDPAQRQHAVHHDEFEATYLRLIASVQPALKGVVLMTPFYIQPDTAEPMRARMDEYGKIVQRVATTTGSIFVDTQAAFDDAMEHIDPLEIAPDRVHPTLYGAGILARAWLRAVKFTV